MPRIYRPPEYYGRQVVSDQGTGFTHFVDVTTRAATGKLAYVVPWRESHRPNGALDPAREVRAERGRTTAYALVPRLRSRSQERLGRRGRRVLRPLRHPARPPGARASPDRSRRARRQPVAPASRGVGGGGGRRGPRARPHRHTRGGAARPV